MRKYRNLIKMKSKVYYFKSSINNPFYYDTILNSIKKIGLVDKLDNNSTIPLKIHSRDMLDCKYINSKVIEEITNYFSNNKINVEIMDTATLYHEKKGEKINLNDYGVKVNSDYVEKDVDDEEVSSVNVLKNVYESDSLIVASHFKGHSMIGFSGSLKNVSTGCVDLESKIKLHKLVKPFISRVSCLACNECIKSCFDNCISVDSIAHIDENTCTGCNACIESCPKDAIKINKINSEKFIELLCKTCNKILENKKNNKVVYINSLVDIKPYYDCKINSKKIVDDIGILVSNDPVAIDRASLDLINHKEGKVDSALKEGIKSDEDKFKNIWRNVDGNLQLDLAEKLGIGSQDYDLIINEE